MQWAVGNTKWEIGNEKLLSAIHQIPVLYSCCRYPRIFDYIGKKNARLQTFRLANTHAAEIN